MIIVRSEVKEIQKIPKWIFVFGRRKTGKTFLVKNFLKYDEYFFVKGNKSILSEKGNNEISYDAFLEVLGRGLKENKILVIDEFHRLGNDFLDFLHYIDKKGKIILISSTLYLSKNLLGSKSPILGLFAEIPLSIITLKDAIHSLKSEKLGKKELIELAILIREPITAEYVSKNSDTRQIISEALIQSVKSIPAMIGEIFTEEERQISGIYEGVLRSVANGKVVSTEISSYLFAKKLIKKDDPSIIQQYLKNLVEFGILKKVKVFDKNKFVYKHVSPLAKLFYYSDEKYNISERILSVEEIKRIVNEIIPMIIEDNIREFLARELSLEENVCEAKDYDVDACLVRFQKVDTAVEIKWKDNIDSREIELIKNNLERLKPKRKILLVPDKAKIKSKIEGIEIKDAFDFVK